MKPKKIAYLTIDDAPSKDFKKKINYLISKKIPAIIFCEGRYIEKRPNDIIYAIKKGFIIGNHSYNHPRFSEISLKKCFGEIKKTDELIEDIYKKSKIKRPIKVFRFPYVDKGSRRILNRLTLNRKYKKLQGYLRGLGYRQPKFKGITYEYFKKFNLDKDTDVFFTYNVEEYRLKKLERIFNKMEKEINPLHRGKGGISNYRSNEIILIHDHPETTHMFEPIINKLLKKGIKFEMPNLK